MKHLIKTLKLGALFFACTVFSAGAEDWSNWMGKVSDEAYIRYMSIPGAHDAATAHGFSGIVGAIGSLYSGYTQSLTISELWDAGIRAFDLRPAYKSGALKIYHGTLETNLTMKAALQTLVDKLDTYPTETAVILIRHETDGDGSSTEWAPAMADLLNEFDNYIEWWNSNLLLGNVRGKIIVLTRDTFTSTKIGNITGWSHSENFDNQKGAKIAQGRLYATLYAQDYYDCSSNDSKYNAVKTMLDYSLANVNNIWVINHTSGYTEGSGSNEHVKSLAKDINNRVAEYINNSTAGRTGMVFMDYAGDATYSGDKLIDAIIMQNTKTSQFTTGAELIESEVESIETDDSIYDITGRLVGRGEDALNNLSNGFYIVNGKKVIIRN